MKMLKAFAIALLVTALSPVVTGSQDVIGAVSTASDQIIPYIASGAGWTTSVTIVNPGIYTPNVKISLFDASGGPVSLDTVQRGRISAEPPVDIPAGGREAVSRRHDWSRVSVLRPGRKVTVVLQPGMGKKIKGEFVRAGPEAITLRTKDGQEQTVPKERIRKVMANRKRVQYAPLVGLLAGAAYTAILLRDPHDLVAWGVAMFIGIGAGIGCGVGWIVRAVAGDTLIYRAPKRESARSPGPRMGLATGWGKST